MHRTVLVTFSFDLSNVTASVVRKRVFCEFVWI